MDILELIKTVDSESEPLTQDSLQDVLLDQFISKTSFPTAHILQSLYYGMQAFVAIPETENKRNRSSLGSAVRSE